MEDPQLDLGFETLPNFGQNNERGLSGISIASEIKYGDTIDKSNASLSKWENSERRQARSFLSIEFSRDSFMRYRILLIIVFVTAESLEIVLQ